MARDLSRTEVRSRSAESTGDLGVLLRSRFGHPAFRPLQEQVCRAVAAGRNVLLVMPTGAGKSLCYQLPGIARGGTTLVLSPLIALMEDQVEDLRSRGFAAERIHSGRDRAESRAVCRRYLEGELDFLFVAPERLAVPGFPELLGKRPPTLIAVDEAHCISHWGHDFRPDYRRLSERLPALGGAPVIALTATATPLVQRDIVEQLDIPDALPFIHGFRRDNIAVEVVEAKPSLRAGLVLRVLEDRGRRPAIVYSPTRKEAEALAAELAAVVPAGAYHAGMAAATRDAVQRAFLTGEIEVIVATIAFGMGIDKPDVRTVIHTALPGTVEGYYQEIGRAGRDGGPSRAILLYSWADRHTHEFFLERDYPEPALLARVHALLGDRPRPAAELRAAAGLGEEVFAAALEKLWIHHGALVDAEENVILGGSGWRESYQAQRAHRRDQVERMVAFAAGRGCRMTRLVQHFGDRHDNGEPCGSCDQCAPADCVVARFRAPTRAEREALAAALDLLRSRDGQSSGQLHRQAAAGGALERRDFESLLDALSRAGLVEVHADQFDKDGRTIRFQRVWLTREGRLAGRGDLDRVRVAQEVVGPRSSRAKPAKAAAERAGRGARPAQAEAHDPVLFDRLREWRLKTARARRVPAFRILTDRTLTAICRALPADEEELLEVPGMGPALVKRYGRSLLELVRAGVRKADRGT